MHYSLIKLIIIITILFNNSLATQNFPEESEDNEFAEFEDFEEDEGKVVIEEHTPTNDPNLSKQSDPDDNYEADMDGIVEVNVYVFIDKIIFSEYNFEKQ